jgi:hypothetical protein
MTRSTEFSSRCPKSGSPFVVVGIMDGVRLAELELRSWLRSQTRGMRSLREELRQLEVEVGG